MKQSKKEAKVAPKTENRGRKTNPNSARQARLAKWDTMKQEGIVVKRGRPSDPVKAAAKAQAKLDAIAKKNAKAIAKATVKVKATKKQAKPTVSKTKKAKVAKSDMPVEINLTNEDLGLMNTEPELSDLIGGFESVDPQE